MITKAIVFDHRGRTKQGQEGPLEVRFIYGRRPYYINTGIKVLGRELKDGKIVNRKDAKILQERLDLFVSRAEEAVNVCIDKNLPINVAEIKRQAYNIQITSENSRTDMLDWIAGQVPILNIGDGTRRRYEVLVRRLEQYDKLTSWSDLSVEAIYKFDSWLHTLRKCSSNADIQAGREASKIIDSTVYNYHRSLRALLTRAVKFGVISDNPYTRLRGEFRHGDQNTVKYLTEQEITAIESLRPIEGTQMAMARDLFVFQMYTGLSYSDTQYFDISEYKRNESGQYVNIGNRIKTGVAYVSMLLPQAVEVLERYGMQAPKVGNVQYNQSLKVIQQALGIKTRLHSHLARHTFATRMMSNGAKIENVSRMLGHTNIRQTERYAEVLAESVYEDINMVAAKLSQKLKT